MKVSRVACIYPEHCMFTIIVKNMRCVKIWLRLIMTYYDKMGTCHVYEQYNKILI